MIVPSDKEYIKTKRIKLGEDTLSSKQNELAQWITDQWGIDVLNVVYDPPNDLRGPRLQVILEWKKEEKEFQDGCNFDKAKQAAIAHRVTDLYGDLNTDDLFVVFSSFEPIARMEINDQVTQQDLERLLKEIGNPDLWTIHRCFSGTSFFFYSEAQKDTSEKAGLRRVYSDRYYELSSKYDELGYLNKDTFWVVFDSKENFDDKYSGNWFNYDR